MENTYPVVMDALKRRRAYRAFSEQKVDRSALESLFEAARLAPSAFNEQPWRYLVATADAPELFSRMLSCLTELNQKWANRAQALAISLAKKGTGAKNIPNRWSWHDAGLALGNLMAAASARGLIAHPMAGFSADRIAETFPDIPGEFEPVTMIAIGYHGDPALLEVERHQQAEVAPQERRAFAETVFEGDWGRGFIA